MIVGSGKLKGRPLKSLGKEPWLRPTTDKAREGVMDVLRPIITGSRVIDLCCGTGAVGIEAFSNGATHVAFVDADPRSIRLVHSNIKSLGLQNAISIVKSDALAYVSNLTGSEFDVIFADPPFASSLQDQLLVALSLHLRAEAEGCIIIMEHASRRPGRDEYAGPTVRLMMYKERRYGDIAMSFYRVTCSRNEAESSSNEDT